MVSGKNGGPGADNLPAGQILHAAGVTDGGWTIVAIHDSQATWERFRDDVLKPKLGAGIERGFDSPPDEKAFELCSFWWS